MKATNEQAKAEAIARMKELKMFPPCIKAFEDRNEIQLSEPNGGLYEFSDNETLNSIIADIEKKYDVVVYHVIHTLACFGELYNILYVSKDKNEWKADHIDLKEHYTFAYVYNLDGEFGEFGAIGIENGYGGLVRTS